MTMCEFCGVDYAGDSYKAKNRHLKLECKKNPYVVGSCFDAPLAKKKPKNNSGSLNSGSVVFESEKMLDKVGIHVLTEVDKDNRGERVLRDNGQQGTQTSAIQTTDVVKGDKDKGQQGTNEPPIRYGQGTGTYRNVPCPPLGSGLSSPNQKKNEILPIKFKDFTPSFPKSWIVKDILGAGTLAVLGGKRATFKSTISISLCVRVAAGLPFLGHHVEKSPVLYLDEENGDAHLYDLVKGTIDALGANEIEKAEYQQACGEGVQIICGKGVAHIWDTLSKLDPESPDCPKLIVMDGLRRFLGAANENDAGEVSVFMQQAKMEAERLGACILFLHHARKSMAGGKSQPDEFEDAMDSLRGSSDIMAAVSTAMITTRVADSTKVMVSFPKTRWGKEPEPVGIEFDIKEGFINMMETGETDQHDFVVNQHAQTIRQWAIRNGESQFTTEQVVNGLAARLGAKTIQRVLSWMLGEQWVRKKTKGVYEIDLPASGQQQIG